MDCGDSAAPGNLRFFACSSDCDKGRASACETLGDLHATEEGLPEPASSAGPALLAWNRACSLGGATACNKSTALRASLEQQCKLHPKRSCRIFANAVAAEAGDAPRALADQLLERACRAGDALGCFERGELHGSWEPHGEHEPVAEREYLRACWLGSAEGCCAMETIYVARGQRARATHLFKQVEKRFTLLGCGHGSRP